jgi:elongation factor P
MLGLSEIKTGKTIIVNSEPYVVIFDQHSKMGRAGAVLRTKLKNLITGGVIQKTFQGADKVEEAPVEKKKVQYLYSDGTDFYFMNNETYDQFSLPTSIIENGDKYLKEGMEVDVLYFNGAPVNAMLPIKVDLEVVEAPPAVKGNTVDGGTKQVTLETGAKVNVPLFIKEGDVIRVNTDTGEYVERAK